MVITGKRHDLRILYRAGVDDAGKILGLEFTHLFRCGWSQDLSLPVADRAMLHADNCYHLLHVRIESHRLKTNTCSATAYRGFGGPQGMVGIERVLDHVAFVVGREPLEVRKANFYRGMQSADASGGDILASMKAENGGSETDLTSRGAAMPVGSHEVPSDGRVQTTPYMMPVEDFIGHELVAELERTSDYRARKAEIARWNAGSPVLKRGIALTPVKFGISFTLTWLNQAGALVHVYQDGSIALNHGGTEMGQGLFQKVAQVTASVFGVDASVVKITATDTGKVPNTSATAASSGADLNGMAAKAAAEVIRGRLAEFIAEKHQVEPAAVRFVDGTVRVAGEVYDWARVVAWAYQARVSLSSTGYYATPKIIWDRVKGVGAAVLLLRLWRGSDRGGDRPADRGEPDIAGGSLARHGDQFEPCD